MGDFITDIGPSIIDFAGNQIVAKQQYERSKKMMDIQFRNQQALNEQGQRLQMQTWQQTNYPAQIAMMKEAGLNPALMYAKGGTSGTTGSQGGGSASMAGVPMAQGVNMGLMLQAQKNKAEVNLLQAEANKTNIEAEKLKGVDTAKVEGEIAKLVAETGESKARTGLIEIQTANEKIKNANSQREIDSYIANVNASTKKLIAEGNLTEANSKNVIAETAQNVINKTIQNELLKAQIKLTDTERQALNTKLVQEWVRLSQGATQIDQKDKEIAIAKLKQEFETTHPNAWQVAGRIVDEAYNSLKYLTEGIGSLPNNFSK